MQSKLCTNSITPVAQTRPFILYDLYIHHVEKYQGFQEPLYMAHIQGELYIYIDIWH